MLKADLHIHSNCSDGSDTIFELYNKIKASNIDIFALTDHDTTAGCKEMENIISEKLKTEKISENLQNICNSNTNKKYDSLSHNSSKNIKFIKGVELTCIADKIKCHILGFGCDIDNQNLIELIEKGKKLRQIKLEARIKHLKDVWNIELTSDELNWLNTRKSVVKTHFANILVNRNLAEDTVSAMKKYLDKCKTPNTRFQIKEAIDTLLIAKAIPVWAHPLGGEGESHLSENEFLKQLEYMISCGIKGIECYYSRYNLKEIEFLIECAKKHNLLISGGSDYHGTNKQNITLAKLNIENKFIDSENLTILNVI